MVYCTAAEVRLILNTSLSNTDLASLITLADAELDGRSLDSLAANLLKTLSMYLTASMVALRDPVSGPVGDSNTTYRPPQEWRRMAETLISRVSDAPFYVYEEPIVE